MRAQLLDAPPPDDLVDVVRHLTLVQHDPIAAVAPSADLVLWSRLGSSYDPVRAAGRPRRAAADRPPRADPARRAPGRLPRRDGDLARAARGAEGRGEHDIAAWVEANDACRRDILELLRADGPLPTSALPDTCQVPWRSSGWNNNQNVKRLLVQMVERGEVATAGRDGREQLWDLAERIYPDDPVPDVDEARRIRDERRLAALGIARARCPRPGRPSPTASARPASPPSSRA